MVFLGLIKAYDIPNKESVVHQRTPGMITYVPCLVSTIMSMYKYYVTDLLKHQKLCTPAVVRHVIMIPSKA